MNAKNKIVYKIIKFYYFILAFKVVWCKEWSQMLKFCSPIASSSAQLGLGNIYFAICAKKLENNKKHCKK